MNDRDRRRVTGACWAALSCFALDLACSARPELDGRDGPAVSQSRAALADGGVAVDHEYTVYETTEVAGGPTARKQPAMAFDSKAGVALLFGGSSGASPGIAETWTYNGRWNKACDAESCKTQPTGRYASALAYVPERDVTVAFGGSAPGGKPLCDTWEWANGAWTSVSTPNCDDVGAVQKRAGHSMVGVGTQAIVFGGFAQAGTGALARSNDLLAWDGQNWASLCDTFCQSSKPAPRMYASLVHARLGVADALLLFGGNAETAPGSGAVTNDLWRFDLAKGTWTELCTSRSCRATAPAARAQHVGVWDATRGKLVVRGGCNTGCTALVTADVAEYDPASDLWSAAPPAGVGAVPAARSDFGAVFDTARRRVVEFGGFALTAFVGSTAEYYTRAGACSSADECHTGSCQKSGTSGAPGLCVETCTASGATGACVNGYVCNAACDQPCQSCARVPGVCTAITSGADDEAGDPTGARCSGDHVCVAGASESAGACKLTGGQPCNVGTECGSGFCSPQSPHVCVDQVCNRPCEVPQGGLCVSRGLGAEPPSLGCGGLRCTTGGACLTECKQTSDCVANYYCDAGQCKATKDPGSTCEGAAECKLGKCVDGVCCESDCDGQCDECGKDGKCTQRTGKVAPAPGHQSCLGSGVCGGYCDGRSECIQPNETTECEPAARCVDRDYLLAAATCNGNGECVAPKTPVSCGAYTCDEKNADCFRECNENAQCRRGAVCRLSADGHGVCNDEGVVCADRFNLRTPGGILDCEGYPCIGVSCAFKACTPAGERDCAPGFSCVSGLCLPTRGGGNADAGRGTGGESGSPEAGVPKKSRKVDAGDSAAELPSESSCSVVAARPARTPLASVALSLVAFALLGRRRGPRR